MKIILGNKNYSSWSLRPWLVLKHLGLRFEEEVIFLYRKDSSTKILKYSPSGKVPVLMDGDITIWDSLAICEYLNEKFPQAQLWPKDLKARAIARAVSAEMHSGFQNIRQNLPMNLRKQNAQKEFSDDVRKEIKRVQQIWSFCLKEFSKGGKFLFRNFSIADAMFAPVILRFRSYAIQEKCDLVLQKYMDEIYQLPAMQEWVVAAGLETEVIPQAE